MELFNEAFVKGDITSLRQIEKKLKQIIDDPVWVHNVSGVIREHKKEILNIHNTFNIAHKKLLSNGEIKNIDEFNQRFIDIDNEFKRQYEQAIMNYWESISARTAEWMIKENKRLIGP